MTNFASDNVTGVSPEIMDALIQANNDHAAMSYGADRWTDCLKDKVSEIFETDVTVFPVISGTAANVLPIASLTPGFGTIYCHKEAHINVDECGASEFYTGGAKLIPLSGDHGKFSDRALEDAIFGRGVPRHTQPSLVSLTQTTEAGTLYQPDEIAAITDIARKNDLKVHMDGARFANAVVGTGCSPADLTWRSGVDVLSFGATKNGAMGAELVVFFGNAKIKELENRRVRGGHFISKMRFLSAQLTAYLDNDLWRNNARQANDMAQRMAKLLSNHSAIEFIHPVEANILFLTMPKAMVTSLKNAGFEFYEMVPGEERSVVRLVMSFNSSQSDVDRFALVANEYRA
ncbi:threonine aldolase [Kiloniella litopenaei]|uniref:L-threonine aldolase n=1 Tax=Kiloniella litopenaei TaxID=1549748 RepID=A0A0M2R9P3_9PROT|nr:low specificity L-threonine aldolase [Kiloniella litopenaei]KKJ76318.1 threonine aldolase [Kiloniella litopenaei]